MHNGLASWDVYSPLWTIGTVGLAFALACLPVFKAVEDPPSSAPRNIEIDGLRGFLALGVLTHHAALYWTYSRKLGWIEPASRFYAIIGPMGVAVFFMITAYLFWGRVIGPKPMDWRGLYVGRLFRIAPLYLIMATCVLVIAFLNVGPLPLDFVFRWLSLGFMAGVDIKGYPSGILLAGVTWTLHYEWLFYLALMPLALMKRWHLLFSVVGFALCFGVLIVNPTVGRDWACAQMFFAGMVCASLQAHGFRLRMPQWAASSALLVLLALPFLSDTLYRAVPIALVGIAFFMVVQGASVFGLLLTRSAIRLGTISFGIYLTHGLCLYLAFNVVGRLGLQQSPLLHWTVCAGVTLVVVCGSSVSYRLVELPAINLGKRVISRMRKPGLVDIPIKAEAL